MMGTIREMSASLRNAWALSSWMAACDVPAKAIARTGHENQFGGSASRITLAINACGMHASAAKVTAPST